MFPFYILLSVSFHSYQPKQERYIFFLFFPFFLFFVVIISFFCVHGWKCIICQVHHTDELEFLINYCIKSVVFHLRWNFFGGTAGGCYQLFQCWLCPYESSRDKPYMDTGKNLQNTNTVCTIYQLFLSTLLLMLTISIVIVMAFTKQYFWFI